MEKKPLRVNIEDVPEDLSLLPENAIIVVDDYDELADDEYWEEVSRKMQENQ